VYSVSKKVTRVAYYNSDTHEPILIIFGKRVSKKVRKETIIYFATSLN